MTVAEVLHFHAALLIQRPPWGSGVASEADPRGGVAAAAAAAAGQPKTCPWPRCGGDTNEREAVAALRLRRRHCVERSLAVMGLQRQTHTLVRRCRLSERSGQSVSQGSTNDALNPL